jgi:hypothetical protein
VCSSDLGFRQRRARSGLAFSRRRGLRRRI